MAREWHKHKFSSRWPRAAGKFERGNITEVIKSVGQITYDAYRMSAAQKKLRSLKNDPFYVRYDPAKLWDSVLNPYRDLKP